MKKILALTLAMIMMLAFVACNNDAKEPSENDAPAGLKDVTDAPADILNNIWAKVPEEFQFPTGGGAMAIEDNTMLTGALHVPEAEVANISSSALLMHMMLANNFTSGAYRLAEGIAPETFAKTMSDALIATEWMCGFPEKLFIAQIGNESVVVVFGVGDLLAPFTKAVGEVYDAESMKVLYDETFPAF